MTLPRANRLQVVKPAPKPADQAPSQAEVNEWIANIPERFMACRARGGHPYGEPKDMWPEGRGWGKLFRCPKCRTELTVHENAAGFIVGTKSEYPAGYLAPKGFGRRTRERNAQFRHVNSNQQWLAFQNRRSGK